jgi:hypothetical protein
MARKKKTTVQEDYVSNDSLEVSNVDITPVLPPFTSIVDPLLEKVKTLRGKGYSNNQIASMLMVHVQKINSI